MLEISVHRNGKKLIDYKKKSFKNTKLYSSTLGLALIGMSEVLNIENLNLNVIDNMKEKVTDSDWYTMIEFFKNINNFIKNFVWCINNPLNALLIFLQWLQPLLLILCLLISSVGVISYMCGNDKIFGATPGQLIKNPILTFLLFQILVYSLTLAL